VTRVPPQGHHGGDLGSRAGLVPTIAPRTPKETTRAPLDILWAEKWPSPRIVGKFSTNRGEVLQFGHFAEAAHPRQNPRTGSAQRAV